jgi:hypothetical protein
MKSLTCLYDSQNEKYILYHSALLVFVLTVVIPINLQLTRFSFAVTTILFAIGFLSLFMIVRNDKVGFGLLKSLRIEGGSNLLSQKMPYPHFNSADNYQDPIVLMQNFVDELSKRHHEERDWTTLDSFRMLNARLAQLVEVKAYDE